MSTGLESTGTERRFLQWLAARAANVEWEYGRWLETPDGDQDVELYCFECAAIQRYVERHNKTGFTRVSGWDDCPSEDSPIWCARCGVLLYHSATKYMLEVEIEGLADEQNMSPENAAILHHAMTCGGEYEGDRDKWWLLIEPEAKRLMGVTEV